MKNSKKLFLLGLIILAGCARAPVKDRFGAMRKAEKLPEISDDLEFATLKKGILDNVAFIKKSSRVSNEIVFGPTKVDKKKYILALEQLANNSEDFESFNQQVKTNFDFYEVYGNEDWAQIKATSYFAPLLKGSLKKTKEHSQALYMTPEDMINIDVDAFAEDFPKWKIFKEQVLEQKSSKALIRARLISEKNAIGKIVPYFKREDIDENNVINNKELVIVYVDPIDSFFLQIQGSGVVELKDGTRFTVGYANQNGHPYVAIGSHLLKTIPREKMSMQTIEAHLRSLSKKEAQKIMNLNPSYVFFQKIDSQPLAYLGTEVVDGRTVATDNGLFPKGTLAFLQYEKPVFENEKSTEPKEWKPSARYILDQDTGGAIRGAGRLDIYAGSGHEAAQFAGVMKNPAKLYYLVPKAEYLKYLNP
jgi:membrane-bound lytic murein transglycosylase A